MIIITKPEDNFIMTGTEAIRDAKIRAQMLKEMGHIRAAEDMFRMADDLDYIWREIEKSEKEHWVVIKLETKNLVYTHKIDPVTGRYE